MKKTLISQNLLSAALLIGAMMVDVTSAYVGDVEETIFTLTTVGNEAVEKGSVYVQSGVQKTLWLPRFNGSADQLQDREADPTTPSDSFTYDERSITPLDAMFYDLFNPRNFEDVWRPYQPSGALVNRVDNPKIQSALMQETMKSIGTQLGTLIWQGDTAAGGGSPLRFFDGFIKIAKADGAIAVTPGGVITPANVIAILESVEDAIPSEIWSDPNVVFHMNTTDYRAYGAAARALDFKGDNIFEAVNGRFAGRQIRHYSGMLKDNILVSKATAGKDSNLWGAVDVAGDDDNVKIERYRPESERFIIKVLFSYAVNTPNPTQQVIYEPI